MRKDGLASVDSDEPERDRFRAVADDGDPVGGKREREGVADGRRRSGEGSDVFQLELKIPDRYGLVPFCGSSAFAVAATTNSALRTNPEPRTKN
ncbi:MAG TPA: hypothetical protein VFC90_00050 [Planctomycetota bacterium]|nr:hypothetical protein [Planctomycetota bacterium]